MEQNKEPQNKPLHLWSNDLQHYWLNGHDFKQAVGVGDGQGSLVCCSPWGRKELDKTERLNNNSETLFQITNTLHLNNLLSIN